MSARTGAASLRRPLQAWYRRARRDLPWRRTRDPYAIWISESMLQQTRVETVIPYYERFLARFPNVRALAHADEDAVLGAWAGLGYYRRARNLRAAAREVVERFDGRLPDHAAALSSLPGVGRYTAGAVASIAFDRPEPVVDGNVARVLARWLGIREPLERTATRARLWQEATAYARGMRPGEANQALMELGARVCTPRRPRCPACPIARGCAARASGDPEALPVRVPRREPARVRGVAALVLRGGRALAVRRPRGGLLGGLWELPGAELSGRERPAAALPRVLTDHVGLRVAGVRAAGALDWAFTHRRLRLHVFRCRGEPGRVRLEGFEEHRWVSPRRFAALPLGTVTRRALELALGGVDPPS